MMRILILVFWLLLPVGALAFHMGPGQNHIKLDKASQLLQLADDEAKNQKWTKAQEHYEQVLRLLPESRVQTANRVQLELAKVQMNNKQLPLAHQQLERLVDSLMQDESTDPELLSESRSVLANSRYYMTWLMRLEGLPRSEWEPEITAAQQAYRFLAKNAAANGDQESFVLLSEDLESAVRLARMDLGELQGLPLPNQ